MSLMDNLWEYVAVALIALAMILGTVYVFVDKHVDGYYLSHSGAVGSSTCVYAHWTWHPDEIAFCTDDYQKALDFAARAQASLKEGK